jgi:hypothetical protein
MRTKPDEVHTERMNVAPGVWAYVDKSNARVLRSGATFALAFGVIGGTLLALLLNAPESRKPFILFSIGYGGSAIIGLIVGLIFGAARASRTLGKK